jgi:hypothetical protein
MISRNLNDVINQGAASGAARNILKSCEFLSVTFGAGVTGRPGRLLAPYRTSTEGQRGENVLKWLIHSA